jgi:glycosyltransferase involved in cell wall biosynthesis
MGSQDGLSLLIESIDYIVNRAKRTDAHFVLVGSGTELPTLRAMVSERGLNEHITFTGQVAHEDVARYLSSGDIGVAPDPHTPMNDKSTMIKILEYMAYGLPVVLFDLKEGRRIAGPAALYASSNDPIDFARQITRLLDSQALRQQLGACGRRRVEQGLNWHVEQKALLEAYGMALK